MEIPFSFGAHKSAVDARTVKHEDMKSMAAAVAALPLTQGGYDYQATEIEHQHLVGICTAISLVQNAQKYIGRRFSPDFQYLLQKKFVDLNWTEGSSILSALKVGKNYGFLPIEEFTYIREVDRNLPYDQYIAKLQAIPDEEVQRLIKLASDYKLKGYAQVSDVSAQGLANAIVASKSGILCRYDVGKEWYTSPSGVVSWNPKDIDPLRPPKIVESGHAITMAKFDYSFTTNGILANTWGAAWNKEGLADIIYIDYRPTEAWIPYYDLTEAQLQELKAKLTKEVDLLGQIIKLWTWLKSLRLAK